MAVEAAARRRRFTRKEYYRVAEAAEVSHLLKPRSAYLDPELRQRVLAVMAE